jgi:hypothetical protein
MYVVDGGIECMVRCCIFMPIRSHFSNVGIDVPSIPYELSIKEKKQAFVAMFMHLHDQA